MHHRHASLALWLAAGCAASAAPAVTPTAPTEAPAPPEPAVAEDIPSEPAEAKEPPREMPTSCASEGEVCTPPADFAERLCRTSYPDIALALFHKSAPWTRAYVRANLEAWYASARRSRPHQLRYAEEVIVIANRRPKNSAFSVSGGGSYDVVRWDGTCVSLMAGELSFHRPATPDVAPIRWTRLDSQTTELLSKDRKIALRNDKRREACNGSEAPGGSRCERAEALLSQIIAEYVRSGGELPPPKPVP